MKIARIDTFAIDVPIRPEVMMITALGIHRRSRYTLVRIETDTGLVGAGEATVSPAWSGETALGAKDLIDTYLAPELLGCDPRDIEGAIASMERTAWANPFAKSAIEMALWDLHGKAEGVPVYQLLGGPARDLALPIRFSLAAADPETTAARARERVAWGHRTIKVKVGLDPETDVARVRAVRAAIGEGIALTVDANGGWSPETAIWALTELADCRLTLAEQPTPRWDVDGMAAVRRNVATPIMADESVFSLPDAQRVLATGAADILAIYPGKNGGILPAWRIASLAAEHHVPCAIGSNLELDVATAAMCHLAVAHPNVAAEHLHGDILGPLYHSVSVARTPVRIEAGFAHCPTAPGLGVEVDWARVASLAIAT